MNINEFKAKIGPATTWFFDPSTEKQLTGIYPQDLRISTGYTGDDPRSPSSVVEKWHANLLASISAGNPSLEVICSGKFWILRHHAETSLKKDFEAARDRTVPLPTLHSRLRLTNLAIKALRAWPGGSSELVQAIYEKGHSALNEPVIDLANQLIKGFAYKSTETDDAKAFPYYEEAQKAIRVFCEEHGTTPVIFDVIARVFP